MFSSMLTALRASSPNRFSLTREYLFERRPHRPASFCPNILGPTARYSGLNNHSVEMLLVRRAASCQPGFSGILFIDKACDAQDWATSEPEPHVMRLPLMCTGAQDSSASITQNPLFPWVSRLIPRPALMMPMSNAFNLKLLCPDLSCRSRALVV